MEKTANDSEKFPERDFSRQNRIGILGVHAMHFALDIFVSVFLVAQILTVTNGDFSKVALFYAFVWGSIILTFWLFSYIVKNFSRVWCIRISTIGLLAGVILILVYQDSLTDWYLILGALWGLAEGIYWCSMHTFTSEAMGGKKMAGYAVLYTGISYLTRLVFPLTLGAVIQFVDFALAVTIVVILAFLLLLFTLILRDQRKSEGRGFSMRAFAKYVRDKKLSRPLWAQFWLQFLYGLFSTATVCTTILVFLSVHDNFKLGYLSSICAGTSIVVLSLYKLIKSPRVKILFYHISSILPFVCSLGLLFEANQFTIVTCLIGYWAFRPAVQAELERARMNLMADFGAEHLHTEGLLFSEASYALARAVGLAAIIFAYFLDMFYVFQVIPVIIMASTFFAAIWLHIWTKKYILVL